MNTPEQHLQLLKNLQKQNAAFYIQNKWADDNAEITFATYSNWVAVCLKNKITILEKEKEHSVKR